MIVLITGAASGIGFQVGKKLAEMGHFVYLTVHYEYELEPLHEKLSSYSFRNPVQCFVLDISNPSDRRKIHDLNVDCLINNAAIGIGGSIMDLPVDQLRKNFEINVFSTIEMIQEYAASLFLRKKKGRCLVVSSMAGIIPLPFMGSYCATKSSLITLMYTLKQELSLIQSDLTVCLIEPGIYQTGFNEWMINNKPICHDHFFGLSYHDIDHYQKLFFNVFSKKKLDSIIRKIVTACVSPHPRFLYRAPISQIIGAKLYMLLFK
ncbi:MAG: SDR family NAD(P)-dependent oxidoreductase [bacterium]|nr:SDR family NAD(P)-dependent oxidoreductase [bacterium]